jgi:hypothetical protein
VVRIHQRALPINFPLNVPDLISSAAGEVTSAVVPHGETSDLWPDDFRADTPSALVQRAISVDKNCI